MANENFGFHLKLSLNKTLTHTSASVECAPRLTKATWLVRAATKIFKNEFRQFVWVLTESRDVASNLLEAQKTFQVSIYTVNLVIFG